MQRAEASNSAASASLYSLAMEPSSSFSWPLLCLPLAIVASSSFFLFLRRRHGHGTDTHHLPPGPPTALFLAKSLPLLRSLHDLTPLLRALHARCGPIISIRLVFRTFIFVADRGAAHRMLVGGAATFASRPPITFEPRRLFTSGETTFSPYGAYWRAVRRNLAAVELAPARARLLAPVTRSVCDDLVRHLRSAAAGCTVVELRPFLRRAMLKLLVHRCFGVGGDALDLDEVHELQRRMLSSLASFPVLAVFPALTKRLLFRRRWAACVAARRRQEELFVPLIHATCGNGAGDTPCYARSLLDVRVPDEDNDGHGGGDGDGDRALTDAEMTSLCSELLNAAGDTTATLIEWIMAELVIHQNIQAKIYAEAANAYPHLINHGDDGDDLQMPYLKAVVLEGLRLHPPVHLVIPHGVRGGGDDDAADQVVVDGYAVPRDAEVNFMVAEMGRDGEVWAAPGEFRPERFVEGGEGHGVDVKGVKEIKMMPFGVGRRMCPGYAVAMRMVEYFVARLVVELEWRVGVEVDMAEVFDFTTVMKHPLRARVVPRS